MTNTDNKLLRILALAFPVVFNVLFFLLPIRRTLSTWICYAFIHFAYLLFALSVLYTGESRSQYQNRAALAARLGVYFLLELLIGCAIIIANSFFYPFAGIPVWITLTVQILLLAVFFVIALMMLLANRHDEEVEAVRAQERQFIQRSAESVRALLEKGPSSRANKAIERVYDKLRTSAVASSPEARRVEAQIQGKIEELNRLSSEEDILETTSEILELIETRSSVLRMSR